MKKYLLCSILVLLLIALVGCATTDPKGLFGTNTAKSVISSTIEKKSGVSIQLNTGYYQYGNMQKNVPGGSFMLWGDEALFLHIINGNRRLYTYNLTTGEVSSYCKDATCKHNSCVASRMLGNLEVYNGKVYTLTFEEMPAEIDGQEKKLLTKARVKSFWHYGGKLYARTADSSLVVFEDDSDEPHVIVEDFPCYGEVIFDHYLYASDGYNIMRVDLAAEEPKLEVLISNAAGITDGRHFYYVDCKTWFLYRCDMDGNNAQLLIEKPVLLASINFDDEFFYYRLYTDYRMDDGPDTHDIYRFPKSDSTRIEKIATLPVPAYQVFTVPGTGKIFVITRDEDNELYVMESNGDNVKLVQIP